MTDLKNLMILALVLACAGLGWKLAGERTAHANTRAAHAQQLKAISDLATEAAQKVATAQQAWQRAVAAIDTERMKEKAHDLAENERLRRAVAAGDRRLRIAASCPARGGDVPAAPGAASVDAGTTVELAPEAGQDILDIRAGIIADQAALKGLQDYVRTVCLGP